MATYFVASGGTNTSPYDTWAKAATSLQAALTAANGGSDIVVIQYDAVPSTDLEMAGSTTYTGTLGTSIISASNDGGSAWTATAMGAPSSNNWIGNSTTARQINFGVNAYVYGVTFRMGGSTADEIYASWYDGQHTIYDTCRFHIDSTHTSAALFLGAVNNGSTTLKNCTVYHGSTLQKIKANGGKHYISGLTLAGSAQTIIFSIGGGSATEGHTILVEDSDLTAASSTANIVEFNDTPSQFEINRSKIPASAVFSLYYGSPPHAQGFAMMVDCDSGDNHGLFAYSTPSGSLVSDTTQKFTSGAAGQSWKISTTSDCSSRWPFYTPWIDLYHTGTSAITPYIEVLRDGSATKYDDDEVWAEFSIKESTGYVIGTRTSDRSTFPNWLAGSGTIQADGAGTGSWSGSYTTPASFKCDSGSPRTPAESGHIRGRIGVSLASISGTIYVDPQIRT